MFSKYYDSRDPPTPKRYRDKIKHIENLDLYSANKNYFTQKLIDLPSVTYPDTVKYFIYTAADIKAHKSLDAYKKVLEG